MNLISVNVGEPKEVPYNGKMIETGIYKEPVDGPVRVSRLNLEGDRQADLTVHGGENMAVYAYSADDYDFWRNDLPGHDLPWGAFGENLTISEISDETIHIGDIFNIGQAELQVTQPRMPCFKLGIKFSDQGFVKRFLDARRNGFYFKVLQEGVIKAGDAVEITYRDPSKLSVRDIVEVYVNQSTPDVMRRALQVDALPESWKTHIEQSLSR